MNIVKKILNGGMNGDDELQLIGDDQTINLMNGRVSVSQYGRDKRIENVAGTTLVTNRVYPPYGSSFTIGSCVDDNRNYLIWANQNSSNDSGIYAYDYSTGTTYVIIYDSQVVGGLGLTKTGRLDRNFYVIGDLLFWTNNESEPRCINYIAGIKSNQSSYVTDVEPYFFPIKYQSSTVIVRPPIYVLTATKQTDSGFLNNFTANNAYQFQYQYVFKNYQTSALSAFSLMVPYNAKADTFNNILIKVPFAEFIDHEVQIVNLTVKYGLTGKTFIIKSWNKNNTADADAIFAHNLGNVQLQFTFYDNVVGIAVDDVTSVTAFSNVPLYSKTLVPAKDRLFLGYNTMGYNTPSESSLSASQSTSGSDTVIFKSGTTYKISIEFLDRFRRKCGAVMKSVTIDIAPRTYNTTTFTNIISWALSNANALNEIPSWAYYYQILITKNLSESFFIQGATQFVVYATKDDNGVYVFTATTFDNTKTAALAVNLQAFTPYGIGYVYSEGDFATLYLQNGTNYTAAVIGQSGNYVLLNPVDIGTIVNNYNFTLVPFSNLATGDTFYWPATADQPTENPAIITQSTTNHDLNPDPPDLGVSNWNINILDGLTRTFQVTGKVVFNLAGATTVGNVTGLIAVTKIPGIITDVVYYTAFSVPMTPGNYTSTVNVTVTVPAGYNRISFLINTTGATPSIDVNMISGNLLFSQDGAIKLIEIYTPNKTSETYYEYGDVYNVTNPTLNTRTYSTLSGNILGDIFRITRTINTTIYYPEAMSPNDNTWQFWQRSLGWSNSFDTIGQQVKKNSLAFSDTYINGTKTNGLCSFQPLNQKDIGSDGGTIQKLVLTNKKQEEGTVMLILLDNEVLSVFLGETQVVAAAQNTFVSVNDGVIGTINELRGNSGTVNPESVIQYLGLVWWVDANNGWISQYSPNGVFPVSSYKQSRFFQRYLNNYLFASKNNLDNINGFHHIAMGVDPFHKEVIVTLPALIYENYATTLPSYTSVPPYATSIINRFDIYDGLGKTMVFKFNENQWGNNFEYMPEWTDYLQNTMFGFKNGNLYIHNNATGSGQWNNFYGTQYPIRVCAVANSPVSGIKNIVTLRLEASVQPDYTVVYSPTPWVQISDLDSSDWTNDEGIFDATVFRDRLSPSVTGTADQKLYSGDQLISSTPLLMAEFQQYNSLQFINFINILYELSRGQNDLIKK